MAAMIDYARFGEQVRDALTKLHDPALLQTHPMRSLLAQNGGTLSVDELQRTLIEAIRQLRPTPGDQSGSRWRRYRNVWLRYVEGIALSEIAVSLGVTERQGRRDHHEGVEAVCYPLWVSHRRAQWLPEPLADAMIAGDEIAEAALNFEISKLEISLPPGPTSLLETLDGALAAMDPLIRGSGLQLRFAVPPHLPPVAMNRIFLRQILIGLVAHLIKFAPGGQASTTAEFETNGIVLKTTMTRFSGPPCESTDPNGGQLVNGVESLDLARQFLVTQGGNLEVRDGDRGQQEISIRFPAAYSATVLVIDDNADFLRFIRRCLEGSTYRMLQCTLADEAPQLAREVRPDVLVIDVLMPSEDGWELLAKLRRDPQTRDIPVVICSVLRESMLAIGLGADVFLQKPVTPLALLSALERARSSRGTC